jgi:hypothetical protein
MQRGRRLALLQALTQLVQGKIGIDLMAVLERAGRRREGDSLEALEAQLGKHELRPVLAQVAEEHQPQPITARHDRETHDPVRCRRPPGRQTARLRQAQLAEEILKRQHRVGVDPEGLDQGRKRRGCIADLGIGEFRQAKMLALAHHHAHQQRLGRPRQRSEASDEVALRLAQQIPMTLGDPLQHEAEVRPVVEGIIQRRGHRGR